MWRFGRTWAALACLMVAHGAAAASFFSPCCYVGDVTKATLADIEIVLEGGSARPLGEVLDGVGSDDSGGQPLHTQRWRYLGQVGPLAERAEAYDANDDGMMDHQELLVLVIVEAARGIGVAARGIAVDGQPVRALAIPGPQIKHLSAWVKRNSERMNDAAVSLFVDVDSLRMRQRSRSGSGSR